MEVRGTRYTINPLAPQAPFTKTSISSRGPASTRRRARIPTTGMRALFERGRAAATEPG